MRENASKSSRQTISSSSNSSRIIQRLRSEFEMSMQSREVLHNFSIINAPEIPDNAKPTGAIELNYATLGNSIIVI